jgi:pimeloyl-ACP methyl ester carboxylesterase
MPVNCGAAPGQQQVEGGLGDLVAQERWGSPGPVASPDTSINTLARAVPRRRTNRRPFAPVGDPGVDAPSGSGPSGAVATTIHARLAGPAHTMRTLSVMTGTSESAALDSAAAAPRRRTRPAVRLIVSAVVAVVLVVVLTFALGWYFSSQVLHLDTTSYPVTVRSVSGDAVVLDGGSDTARPVRVGLTWPGGHAVLDDHVSGHPGHVTRTVMRVTKGSLTTGVHAYMDMFVYAGDPQTARDLAFSTVSVSEPLGSAPAWYVPPTTSVPLRTWVIAVHGRGASRAETLRVLPALAAGGVPTLAITYRNDTGSPASPDRSYHLGDTEWRDVAAAIGYARAHGVQSVILYGWSMGGGMVLTALRRMPPADTRYIDGLVLDSPVLDWKATLDLQGAQRHLPQLLTWTAEKLVEQRAGLSLDGLNQLTYAPRLRVPVLLFVDRSDTTVPPDQASRLAHRRPDLVTLVTTAGGDHTGSWNVDPGRYETALQSFVAGVTR